MVPAFSTVFTSTGNHYQAAVFRIRIAYAFYPFSGLFMPNYLPFGCVFPFLFSPFQASWIRIRNTDPDPDGHRMRIRILIRIRSETLAQPLDLCAAPRFLFFFLNKKNNVTKKPRKDIRNRCYIEFVEFSCSIP
jgi:hypothetical protein